jgi:hypothetical protein
VGSVRCIGTFVLTPDGPNQWTDGHHWLIFLNAQGYWRLTPTQTDEVKSHLTGAAEDGEIRMAFDNIRSVKHVDPKINGFIFGFGGNQSATFVKHVKTWSSEGVPVARTLSDRRSDW